MTDMDAKLGEIRDMASDDELSAIGAKLAQPDKVVCPFNKRYVQLPAACIGYHYICQHLDRSEVRCNHPEKRQWQDAGSGPGIKMRMR